MKVERIEVLAHAREPAGSFAIIKLFGIDRLEGPATFRLEPAGDAGPRALGWPDGDLRPIGVRAGNGTVELLIGPEITKSSALVKGTAVRFRMPAAEVDLTLEWPDLSQAAPADPPAMAAAPSTAPDPPPRVAAKPAPSATPNRSANGVRPPEKPANTQGLARLQRRGPAAAPPLTDIAKPPPQPVAAAASPEGRTATVPPPPPTDSVAITPPVPPADTPAKGRAPAPAAETRADASPPAVVPAKRRATAPPPVPTAAVPTGIVATKPPPPPAAAQPPGRPASEPPAVLVEAAQSPPPPMRASISIVPFALGLVIVAAMLVTFLRTTTIEGTSTTLYAALMNANAGIPDPTAPRRPPHEVLSEILAVGATSPSGIDAAGTSQREALERANALLVTGHTAQQRAEAAYWLRKALSTSLSEPRLVWAVTQLGASYASGDKAADYEAARLLWSWAADAGDAQAACFLGRLFENGLGVPSDAAAAQKHYQHARRLGGCPGLEQAMNRLGR